MPENDAIHALFIARLDSYRQTMENASEEYGQMLEEYEREYGEQAREAYEEKYV